MSSAPHGARFWPAVLMIALCAVCTADEESRPRNDEEVELGEVEVMATPVVEPTITTRYGAEVSTVTEEQMGALNAQDLPSAVRRVPGVSISRYNLVGSYGGREGGAVFVRGMGGARPGGGVLTMIDGIPKTVGVWTHPLMDVLNVDNAERIDIYKAPNPLVFGNIGYGAFDLVLKRRLEPGFETRVFGAGGMHETFYETLEHGGRVGPWDYYVVQSIKQSDGHRHQSAGRLENYYLRLGYALSEHWDLSYAFIRTNNRAEDPGHEDFPPPVRGLYKTRDDMHIFTLSNHCPGARGHIKLYWDNLHADWEQFDPAVPEPFDSITDHDNYGLRARQTLWPWDGGEVVVGFDWDNIGGRFLEARPSGNKFQDSEKFFHIVSPYAGVSHMIGRQDEWHVIPSAGVRYNSHNEFREVWAPQFGLVAGRGETEFHAAYSRGLNYPGVYAVFMSESQWGAGDAWKDLDPELLDHWELGVSHRLCPWAKARAVAFWNNGEDRIRFVPPPPPPPHFQNIGDFKTHGVELSITVTPEDGWTGFLGATFLTDIEPRNLPYAPKRSLSGGVSYRFADRWQLDVDGQYVSDFFTDNPRFPGAMAEVDDYWLFNGKVSCDVTPKNGKFKGEVFAAVENIFDQDYEYRDGYPMPGTTVMAGLDLSF